MQLKSTVHKFDLWDFMVQEKLQLRKYQIETPEAHGLIDRRKAVTAGKRTPAAALIVDDPVLESRHIMIVERDLIETQKALGISPDVPRSRRSRRGTVIPG